MTDNTIKCDGCGQRLGRRYHSRMTWLRDVAWPISVTLCDDCNRTWQYDQRSQPAQQRQPAQEVQP